MLKLRQREFVEAARAYGASTLRIVFKHCLVNGLTPWLTLSPFMLSGLISTLAALDYLGFGLPPPTPSWGSCLIRRNSTFASPGGWPSSQPGPCLSRSWCST